MASYSSLGIACGDHDAIPLLPPRVDSWNGIRESERSAERSHQIFLENCLKTFRFLQARESGKGGHVFSSKVFDVDGDAVFRSGKASQDVSR